MKKDDKVTPRPLLDNLERLAIAIHEMFNQKQLERHPNIPLAYPRFADLPDTLKYSNIRQARGIVDKLELMGWQMKPINSSGNSVKRMTSNEIELLAKMEHNEWVKERISTGWTYGKVKDVDRKISPYILPYEELTEEVKELDRDTIRNIPALLEMIGMAIYRR